MTIEADFIHAVATDSMGRFCEQYGLGKLEWLYDNQLALYRRVAAAVRAGEGKDQSEAKAEHERAMRAWAISAGEKAGVPQPEFPGVVT